MKYVILIGEIIVSNKLEHIYKTGVLNKKRCKRSLHPFGNTFKQSDCRPKGLKVIKIKID